jgi:hypothetical protein
VKNAETREKPKAREKRSNTHEKCELAQVGSFYVPNWLKLTQVGSSQAETSKVSCHVDMICLFFVSLPGFC